MNVPLELNKEKVLELLVIVYIQQIKEKREEKKFLCYGTSSKKKIFKAH